MCGASGPSRLAVDLIVASSRASRRNARFCSACAFNVSSNQNQTRTKYFMRPCPINADFTALPSSGVPPSTQLQYCGPWVGKRLCSPYICRWKKRKIVLERENLRTNCNNYLLEADTPPVLIKTCEMDQVNRKKRPPPKKGKKYFVIFFF